MLVIGMRGTMMRFGLALVWFGSEFRMTLLTSLLTVLPTVYLVLLDVLTCFVLFRSTRGSTNVKTSRGK